MKEIFLTVQILEGENVQQKHVRISYESMDELGIRVGDIIEINGNRTTSAKCLPLFAFDKSTNAVKLDSLTCKNAGVIIGDKLTLKRIECMPAEKVILQPFVHVPKNTEIYVSHVVEGLPLTEGDEIKAPYLDENFQFKVHKVFPSQTAVVLKDTRFYLM